jgi:CheY-like chemotaxis protein
VRYTSEGGVLVGCRQRGETLRIEIWDSGPGIPEDQRQNIFGEFYQLAGSQRDSQGGLGLGLAIVDRLRRLLGHSIELSSIVDKGSRFTITVPSATARKLVEPVSFPPLVIDRVQGKLVVVIDDDALVLEGTGGLLRSWGCRVVTAASHDAALGEIIGCGQRPDVIISDYHLSDGKTGIDVIERVRAAFGMPIPAFLISGDVTSEPLRHARTSGYHLLHKPLAPMALRAMLNQYLKTPAEPESGVTVTMSSAL